MQEGKPLEVVRAWVQKVRQRMRSLGSDDGQGDDADLSWLAAGGESIHGSYHNSITETDHLLDSDHDDADLQTFGPLELGSEHDSENVGNTEHRVSTPSQPICNCSDDGTASGDCDTEKLPNDLKYAELGPAILDFPDQKLDPANYDSDDSTFSIYTLESDDESISSTFSTVESTFASIVKSVSSKQQSTLDFLQLFEPWRDKRTLTLHTLRSLADDLEHHRLNVNIGVVTGSSVGATGGVLAIVGLALAPETLGVSLILTAVGTAASVAGGVTALGSNIADCVITSKRIKVAQTAIDEDAALTTDLHHVAKRLVKATDHLQCAMGHLSRGRSQEILEGASVTMSPEDLEGLNELMLQAGVLDGKPDAVKLASSCVQVTAAEASAVGALEQGIARAVATAAEDTSIGLSVAARAAGITFSVLAVGLDIYKIITTSIDLAGGSPSEAANKLKKIALELEDELTRIADFYSRICGDSTERNDIDFLCEAELIPEKSSEEIQNSNNEKLETSPVNSGTASPFCSLDDSQYSSVSSRNCKSENKTGKLSSGFETDSSNTFWWDKTSDLECLAHGDKAETEQFVSDG